MRLTVAFLIAQPWLIFWDFSMPWNTNLHRISPSLLVNRFEMIWTCLDVPHDNTWQLYTNILCLSCGTVPSTAFWLDRSNQKRERERERERRNPKWQPQWRAKDRPTVQHLHMQTAQVTQNLQRIRIHPIPVPTMSFSSLTLPLAPSRDSDVALRSLTAKSSAKSFKQQSPLNVDSTNESWWTWWMLVSSCNLIADLRWEHEGPNTKSGQR